MVGGSNKVRGKRGGGTSMRHRHQSQRRAGMKPIAYINVEKRTLEFAEPIKWHTPTVANLDRIPLFTKEALAQPEQEPVANIRTWRKNGELHAELWNWDRGIESLPDGEYDLYTTPPQRVTVFNQAGVYAIFNRASDKMYIGSSVNMAQRWSRLCPRRCSLWPSRRRCRSCFRRNS